jgi:hypothetical protein
MVVIIGRVKRYETSNVIIAVPGEEDKHLFVEAVNRQSAYDNFPEGTAVQVITGDKKTTKGTVMDIQPLDPEANAILIGQELEQSRLLKEQAPQFETAVLPEEWRKHLPRATPDYKSFTTTTEDLRKEAQEKEMVPDVNVSVRDALIAQQSCLNRAVEIFQMENPDSTTLLASDLIDIIFIKDQLFADIWEKAGMAMKEKKE